MSTAPQLRTLSYVEKIQFEDLKNRVAIDEKPRQERGIYFGFVVVAVVATLIISGALQIDLGAFRIR